MHELSLTRDAVDLVVQAAQEAGAQRVQAVYFTVGEGRDIVAPLFKQYFAYLAKDGVAEGAELHIEALPLMMRCRVCGHIYAIDVMDRVTWNCPDCGACDYAVHTGMEFTIDRIEIV